MKTWITLWLFALVLLAVCASAQETVKLSVANNVALVPVRVNGQSLLFVLDTGSESSAINAGLVTVLGLKTVGDVQILRNYRIQETSAAEGSEFKATNGELIKVKSLDGGAIHLEDRRTLPANYHEFTHGYAVTAHRSQGKTVDTVIISADAMKKELAYVAASRGRSEIVSSPATASNFVNPSVYPRCGSPQLNWLENSYPRTM